MMGESEDVTSRRLSSVGTEGTEPEMIVRRQLEKMDVHFDANRDDLQGTPDVVLPEHDVIVFVHGCFWHQHEGCEKAPTPKRNRSYWEPKFLRNKKRDEENERALQEQGWEVGTIWECETENREAVEEKLRNLIGEGGG